MNDEKTPLQSNWTCSFVWKRRLAVDRPVGGQHMHPSGVQFGLSRGLRQLRGEEILLSDQLLETISLHAQMYLQLGRPAIRGNFLVDITVRAAQDALGNQYQGRREEIVPFFASGRVTAYCSIWPRTVVPTAARELIDLDAFPDVRKPWRYAR